MNTCNVKTDMREIQSISIFLSFPLKILISFNNKTIKLKQSKFICVIISEYYIYNTYTCSCYYH